MKILKKIYPYLIFIVVAYVLWWSPDYWHPGTYFNLMDAIFPFKPEMLINQQLYAWKDFLNEGLGGFTAYASGIHLYFYTFISILKNIGVPLWICNRLFLFIPTFLLQLTSYYMILSFVKEGSKKQIGAILGSIFLTTSTALMFIDPMLQFATAGMILSFASLKRYIDYQKNYHLLGFAFGFLFMTIMPRHIYLSIFFLSFFLICWNILNRDNFKHNFKIISRLFGIGIILLILLSFYSFLPMLNFLFKHSSSEIMPRADYLIRINLIDSSRGAYSPLYILRLINSIDSFYNLSNNYFSNNFNLIVSFLLLFYLFIPFFIKKISKEILYILLTSVFLLFWVILSNFDIYKTLMINIPAFWIMNNPAYILMALALMYSILLANSTTQILSLIEKKIFSIKIKNILLTVFTVGILVLIIINNGYYFFDRLPKPSDRGSVEGDLQNFGMGNHLPYFKIPLEYQTIEDVLPDEDKDARVFVLPLNEGKMLYSWWPYVQMVDILAPQLTSLRLGGQTRGNSDSRSTKIEELILNGEYDNAINQLRFLGYKYIFIHKDMKTYFYFFEDELKIYLTQLSANKEFEVVMDNNYFRLLKLKPMLNSDYAFPSVAIADSKTVTLSGTSDVSQEPQITFKKINPTKYLVRVEGAKDPFWLKFSESFHDQWYLYQVPDNKNQIQEFGDIVADYPDLKVKEARYLIKYTPEDIRFLFKKSLDAPHQLVNNYANGWYIEPNKLGLPEDFTLVIYFWPQSLFYVGLGISVLTIVGCFVYILWIKLKKLSNKEVKKI